MCVYIHILIYIFGIVARVQNFEWKGTKENKRGTHAITEIAIPRRDGGVVETGMTLSEIIIQTYVYQSV